MDKKYLYVLDGKLAETLIKDGFTLLTTVGKDTSMIWVFENTKSHSFSKDDSQKVHYSNTLRMYF